jgi:antitoxin component YwqK of YwqJK toxin-antitoxin module
VDHLSKHADDGFRRWHWFIGALLVLVLIVLGAWVRTWSYPQQKVGGLSVVARTNLVFSDGRWYLPGGTNAFTGVMVEFHPDGMLCSRTAVSNGLLEGLSEGWYTNGQPQIRECYKASVADGLRQKWYSNGQLKSEATILQGKLEGTFRSWHENGQVAEIIELKAGQPDGEAWAFYSSGFARSRTALRAGQVLARESWEDGERRQASVNGPLIGKAN